MKKLILAIIISLLFSSLYSQSVTESTAIKRFSLGADIFTDIWMNHPPGDIGVRTINQGVNVFGMYNFPLGESNFHFAIGLGMGFHNFYTKGPIEDIKADTIVYVPQPDTLLLRKYKLGLSYVDLPIEFRFKNLKKFRFALGFKVGYLLDAKTKYKGERMDKANVVIKEKQVSNVETFRFGPTVRLGWNWISLYAYYQISHVFENNRGPEKLYPISVGITLLPF
jgi:hypothetical protein